MQYRLIENRSNEECFDIWKSGYGKDESDNAANNSNFKQMNIWVFDPKLDYRYLVRHFDNLIVMSWEMIIENILKGPEGYPPQKWLNDFCDFFTDVFSGLIIVKSVLFDLVNELYVQFGVYESSNVYPNFIDLVNLAESKRYPKFQKRDYVLDSLKSRLGIIKGVMGRILNCSKGFLNDLLFKNVIFEMSGLNYDLQNLIVQWFSFYQYAYRISHGIRGTANDDYQTVIIVDEAKRIFDRSRDSTLEGSISPFAYLISMTREFQMSFVLATQEYHRLSSSLKSSAYTTIAFNSQNYEDLVSVSKSIGLPKERISDLQGFNIGEAFIKKGNLEIVKVNVPFVDIKKD